MIRKTSNYDQFKLLERNRRIYKSHLRRLEQSVSADNRLADNPIIVNEDFEVIDGQHRLAVARNMNVPIYYVVSGNADINTVARLQTQKSWTPMDWVESFEKAGNDDYEVLHKFMDAYKLPISVAVSLLTGSKLTEGGGLVTDLIKSGNFKVKSLKHADTIAGKYKEIHDLIRNKFSSSRPFVIAVTKLVEAPEYNHKHMLEKLKKYGKRLTKQDSVRDYMRELEEVYNLFERTVTRLF